MTLKRRGALSLLKPYVPIFQEPGTAASVYTRKTNALHYPIVIIITTYLLPGTVFVTQEIPEDVFIAINFKSTVYIRKSVT